MRYSTQVDETTTIVGSSVEEICAAINRMPDYEAHYDGDESLRVRDLEHDGLWVELTVMELGQ